MATGDARWLLDAGGGSLLFTAGLYLQSQTRPILVLAVIADFAGLLDTGDSLMYVTSLIVSGRVTDLYLRALYLAGGFARPRTEGEIRRLFEAAKARQVSVRVQGNMAYVTASRAAERAVAPDAAHT